MASSPSPPTNSSSDTSPISLNGEDKKKKKNELLSQTQPLQQQSYQPLSSQHIFDPSSQQPPIKITQQPPQPRIRQQRRNSRSLAKQNSLEILHENMPIDETTEEEVDRRRSSIGSLTSSINSCS